MHYEERLSSYLNFAMIPEIWSFVTLPKTSPPTVITGASPQQPTQRTASREKLPSAVTDPTGSVSC